MKASSAGGVQSEDRTEQGGRGVEAGGQISKAHQVVET